MPNSTISPKSLRKVLLTFLVPLPFILAISVYLSELSIKAAMKSVAEIYVNRVEVLVSELRDENKQALYSATSCEQIQNDLLFETYLREMFVIEDQGIVCSSKRTIHGTSLEQYQVPEYLLHTGEFLYDLPKYKQRSLIVVDQDENNPNRFAVSIIDSAYLNIRLGINSDDRIFDSHLIASGLYYPKRTEGFSHNYNITVTSQDGMFKVTVEPSNKLKNDKRVIYILGAVPISLLISILYYLINFWLKSRGTLVEDLKNGLKNNELFLVYQPLINSKTGQMDGVEALIRWHHPRNGLIRPDLFIPMAEQHGIINLVTDFVLERALQDWSRIKLPYPQFHIGVNIPPSCLSRAGCIEYLKSLSSQFKQHDLQLCIEITERQLLDESGRRVLSDIRQLGIKVAIDDFGTGYTSLSVIQDTDVDYLKIDRCFINTIGIESINAPVLNNIINLAHDMKVEIVAEGVETLQQASYLRDHGVELLQGYYFYKPLPIEQLLDEIKQLQQDDTQNELFTRPLTDEN